MRMNFWDILAYLLLIVGGINWALTGLFDYNLVSHIFGAGSTISKIIYGLIGLSALYGLFAFLRQGRAENVERMSGEARDRDDRTYPAEQADRSRYGATSHREGRTNRRSRR